MNRMKQTIMKNKRNRQQPEKEIEGIDPYPCKTMFNT